MNRRQKIIVSVTGIFIVLLALVGLTYAYFVTQIEGNKNDTSISVTTANLEVTYEDGTAFFTPYDTKVTEEMEGTDKEGIMPGDSFVKKFYVKNTGNAPATFSIKIDNVVNTFFRNDWTFELKQGDTVLRTGRLPYSESYLVNSIELPVSDTRVEYTLTITYEYLDIDQSVDMNADLSFRVNIDNEIGKVFNTAGEGTLLKRIGNDNLISQPISEVGEVTGEFSSGRKTTTTITFEDPAICELEAEEYYENEYGGWSQGKVIECIDQYTGILEIDATIKESVLMPVETKNGSVYQFRGQVENNYVTYSGMLWRIVNIETDGSIKMILQESNLNLKANFGYSKVKVIEATAENGLSSEDELILSIEDYLNPTEDASNAMVNVLKNFEQNLSNKETYLKSGNWCFENKYYDDNGETITKESILNKYKNFDMQTYYTNPKLSLDCQGNNMNKYNDDSNMYAGSLTLNEVIYSGEKKGATFANGHINEKKGSFLTNYNGYGDISTYLFTIDQFNFGDYPFMLGSAYYPISSSDSVNTEIQIRPVIRLLKTVSVSEGNGTKAAPYVIN